MSDKVLVMKGVEGLSVYINDYRVAGPKPWGGGSVVKEWTVERKDIDAALKSKQPVCCGGVGCPSCLSVEESAE